MNKEVHYEGWLIKSPPTKRVWRARWRRRWFTLKQGEIPEQFCLEYYTDRNCRKLKGVIDLDQCEQVDSGLRLENRKQKFQFLFDIKTPKRTYYLAADTDADMRDWVNCICQVCHLHDTKQSNELQPENRMLSNSTNNTTTTTLNSSTGATGAASGALASSAVRHSASFNNDVLRRSGSAASSSNAANAGVIDQQPQCNNSNSNDCAYVNTEEYTNRDTVLCDVRFERQQLIAATTAKTIMPTHQPPPPSPGIGLYLNSPVFQALTQHESARLAVNANGVVRKIPENLVLNQTPLPEAQQQHSVQPSPALSTASGPYIPISECFSGSPKFITEGNNPTTPLNNLDPKFYDTPRSHNNIGLNLTNDQSYSPKITNCSLQQMAAAKDRSHRSDSDSESVFTDDDEWTHPLPLRENVDRRARPSDSSVENESFVLTYSQRFSKVADEAAAKEQRTSLTSADPLEKLAKVLKNKNNLILDFRDNEKITRDLPQLSDTENTSPAIGPRDASSVVEENYDIPRSHNLPYYNMSELLEKITSPTEANPIAASTPNLMLGLETGPDSPMYVRTLPRQHCYTNAAPSKLEGDVFRYDFSEQADLPPVNRKLKPKKVDLEDKPPEEVADKPPISAVAADSLIHKLLATNLHSPGAQMVAKSSENLPFKPPSIDRKLKPDAYKLGNSATLLPSSRRNTSGVPFAMVPNNSEHAVTMTSSRTLPRQMGSNYADGHANATTIHHQRTVSAAVVGGGHSGKGSNNHQRTVSAAAAMPQAAFLQLTQTNEHKLQYFDLDVANAPAINRQSMSVGNLNAPSTTRAVAMPADPAARAQPKSGVVYNSVDFVKTEAFKRIREEREKESEGGVNSNNNNNNK